MEAANVSSEGAIVTEPREAAKRCDKIFSDLTCHNEGAGRTSKIRSLAFSCGAGYNAIRFGPLELNCCPAEMLCHELELN